MRVCHSPRRLTFWWSNVLQLRWMFWALCHGHGDALAGSTSLDGSKRRTSEQQLSPRGSLAAAAAAARGGQDWMQARGRHACCVCVCGCLLGEWWSLRMRRPSAHPGPPMLGRPRGLQALVPQLRELESWLFGEMLRHLWWRVLLQSVTTLKLPSR